MLSAPGKIWVPSSTAYCTLAPYHQTHFLVAEAVAHPAALGRVSTVVLVGKCSIEVASTSEVPFKVSVSLSDLLRITDGL